MTPKEKNIDAHKINEAIKLYIHEKKGWSIAKINDLFDQTKKVQSTIYEMLCEIDKVITYQDLALIFSSVSGIPYTDTINGTIVEAHKRYFITELNGTQKCYIWHPLVAKHIPSSIDCSLLSKDVFDKYCQTSIAEVSSAGNIRDKFFQMIKNAIKQQATDIHIFPVLGKDIYKIEYRILGDMCNIDTVDYEVGRSIVSVIINTAKQYTPSLRIDDIRRPQDARIQINKEEIGQDLDIRVSILWKHDMKSADIVLRLLYKTELSGITPEHLGFSSKHARSLVAVTTRNRGIVIVTGATGSGKSKTINCLLSLIPRERTVLTVEDPIEYILPNGRQFQTLEWEDTKEGKITSTSFSEFARAFKRHDPDVVFIGELRDIETVQTAMHLSKTGHLVFATLHAARATMIPEILTEDYGIAKNVVADNLIMGVNQILVKHLCDKCKESDYIEDIPEWVKAIRFINSNEVNKLRGNYLHFANKTKHCPSCEIYSGNLLLSRGYTGRTVIAEVYEFHSEMFDDNISSYAFEHKLISEGNLLTDAIEKIIEGKIEIGSLKRLL